MITQTVEVRRGVVSQEAINAVLCLMWDELWTNSLANIRADPAHWFPHLRSRPEVAALRESLPPEWQTDMACEPQILWQLPHRSGDPIPEIKYHTDNEPWWAEGRRYTRIVAVPLTAWSKENGGLILKPKRTALHPPQLRNRIIDGTYCPYLQPGDVICMTPDVEHSGGINLTAMPRIGVYFRWLA